MKNPPWKYHEGRSFREGNQQIYIYIYTYNIYIYIHIYIYSIYIYIHGFRLSWVARGLNRTKWKILWGSPKWGRNVTQFEHLGVVIGSSWKWFVYHVPLYYIFYREHHRLLDLEFPYFQTTQFAWEWSSPEYVSSPIWFPPWSLSWFFTLMLYFPNGKYWNTPFRESIGDCFFFGRRCFKCKNINICFRLIYISWIHAFPGPIPVTLHPRHDNLQMGCSPTVGQFCKSIFVAFSQSWDRFYIWLQVVYR